MNKKAIELLDEGIEEIYNFLMEKPFKVLEIFNDFFGEENVDMQDYTSLDVFKSIIKGTSIGVYISVGNNNFISTNEWELYKSKTIVELINCPDINITDALPDIIKTMKIFFRYSLNNIANILVHFPHVRVTNEYDKYTDINHLWAKITIDLEGKLIGSFGLNRSEYSLLHFRSNYLHSHVSYIPTSDFTYFQIPCTGRGPINGTIITLNRDYDEDFWNLFCLELSKFVTVESVEGVPYHYLEKLGGGTILVNSFITYFNYNDYHNFSFKEFAKYFVSTKKLKFNYVNGSYSIGMSLFEYMVLVSNEFIRWYNHKFNMKEIKCSVDELFRKDIIVKCTIKDNKIFRYDSDLDDNHYTRFIGKKICTFKGKEITVNIIDTEINNNISIMLNPTMALYLLRVILEVLNYKYGKNENITEGSQSDTKVRYL